MRCDQGVELDSCGKRSVCRSSSRRCARHNILAQDGITLIELQTSGCRDKFGTDSSVSTQSGQLRQHLRSRAQLSDRAGNYAYWNYKSSSSKVQPFKALNQGMLGRLVYRFLSPRLFRTDARRSGRPRSPAYVLDLCSHQADYHNPSSLRECQVFVTRTPLISLRRIS